MQTAFFSIFLTFLFVSPFYHKRKFIADRNSDSEILYRFKTIAISITFSVILTQIYLWLSESSISLWNIIKMDQHTVSAVMWSIILIAVLYVGSLTEWSMGMTDIEEESSFLMQCRNYIVVIHE
jgi:hypothetical protein